MANKALFLDLDGTVRTTANDKPCPSRPDEQNVMDGRYDKIWDYKNKGYKIVAVTNQGGIGLGYMTKKDCEDCLEDINHKLGKVFDLMLYAPDSPHVKGPMTKPNPGMLVHAAGQLDIDLKKSLMVGDRDSDKGAAENAGVKFEWAKDFFNDK